MSGEVAVGVPIDAFSASLSNLIVLVFAKTTSPYYQHALSIARGATYYHEESLGKEIIHTVAFAKSPEQAARAIALLRYVSGWHSLQAFISGRLHTGDNSILTRVLDCYQTASHCKSHLAHCCRFVEDVFREPKHQFSHPLRIDLLNPSAPDTPRHDKKAASIRFVSPCRLMPDNAFLQKDHPASWEEQVQALAVSLNIDWCPMLSLGEFRQFK